MKAPSAAALSAAFRAVFALLAVAGCVVHPVAPPAASDPGAGLKLIPPVAAAKAPATKPVLLTAEVKTQLAPDGTLQVGILTANPVIGGQSKKEGVHGTTAMLAKALAEKAGVPLALVGYSNTQKLVDDLRYGAVDLAVLPVDLVRSSVIDYLPAHLVVDTTLLVPAGSPIRSIADVDRAGMRIAAARGGNAQSLMRTLRHAKLVLADSEPAALGLLKGGKADGWAQLRHVLVQSASVPGYRVLEDSFTSTELAFAVPKGRPAARAYLAQFLDKARRDGHVAQAIRIAGFSGVRVAP